MLKGSRLQDALEAVQKVFDKVNHKYIRKIAEQIKRIGKLNPSSVNRLTEMAEMTEGSRDIKRDLAKAIGTGKTEVNRLFTEAMNDAQNDKRFKYAFQRGKNLRPEQRQRLVQYTNLVYMQTAGTMDNLSNTTLIEQNYRDAVDEAIMAVNAGIADYGSAIRDILRKTGSQGIQVVYPSGAHRRLDTALRQNITNGAKQVSQKSAEMIGEALGYDAWELTAHLHAAPDHEPVQGHIFLKEEFEKLQAGYDFKDWKGRHYLGFPRSIGEWNCMHMALPFSTEFSKPTYTDRQLREWQEMNAQGCEYRGKHLTIYEASQYMRQIETQVRAWKDTAIAAEAAGDDILRRECQYKINTLGRQYNELASASGLAQQRNRMAVEGFHAVSANKLTPEQLEADRLMRIENKRKQALLDNPSLALPNADKATAADAKFKDYLFNPENKKGYAKGVAFEKILGYNKNNWKELQEQIRQKAKEFPVTHRGTDQYGESYNQLMILHGPNGRLANVLVAWKREGGETWLVTAMIKRLKA